MLMMLAAVRLRLPRLLLLPATQAVCAAVLWPHLAWLLMLRLRPLLPCCLAPLPQVHVSRHFYRVNEKNTRRKGKGEPAPLQVGGRVAGLGWVAG